MATLQSRPPEETILVADDDVLVRAGIAEYLRGCGYRVVEAATVDEALTVLESDVLEVETVLCSVEIKDASDGFALARWVRSNRPGVEVVLAANPARAVEAAADLCHSGPMLARPYEPQQVLDRIRRKRAVEARRAAQG